MLSLTPLSLTQAQESGISMPPRVAGRREAGDFPGGSQADFRWNDITQGVTGLSAWMAQIVVVRVASGLGLNTGSTTC